ncbi:MAG: SRPBCC domain-containing protein, partial [Acetobacteraceae bacterium]|nr:SRPBCC domain-containing protein [Acetobacteraceae bacterium]
RARVFEVWTKLEHLQRWFGPKGVRIPEASLDLRPGGLFHYRMTTPDGTDMWGKWRFDEISAPDRLVSVVSFSDPAGNDARAPWDAAWPLHTRSTITFREAGEETAIRVDWVPQDATEQERQRFAQGIESMRQGWSGTMDRLAEYLTTKPEGTMSVTPYLNLNGRCAEALRFYEQALGATVTMSHTFANSPMAEKTPPEWRDKIMHVSFTVRGTTLMASDGMPGHSEGLSGFSLSIPVADEEEAERVFNALAEGGTVRMPLQQTFWAVRFGMLTDRFGVPWMVNCEKPAG